MFSKRLKQLRKERKLTMQEVAEAVKIARSTYAGYESGYRQPTLDNIQLIAVKLQTSVDYLIGLTEQPDPTGPSHNACELLNRPELHWNGTPLTEEDLKLVRMLLERAAMRRSGYGI